MKLYPVPGGIWTGTEAEWKKAMKARGLDAKAFEATKSREVPTAKADLMEFLTFYAVDVYRLGDQAGAVVATEPEQVDVDALRALHNPTAPRPSTLSADRIVSQMDNPGVDIEGMIAFICNAEGATLKRFAGAVAMAFQQQFTTKS